MHPSPAPNPNPEPTVSGRWPVVATISGYCRRCGSGHGVAARFCPRCGFALGQVPPVIMVARPVWTAPRQPVREWPVRRPVWLVIGLTLATYGLYVPVWLGLTWAEMRMVRRDLTMSAPAHAFAMLVPGLNVVRFHRHFAAIAERARSVDDRPNMGPRTAAILITLAAVLFILPPGAWGLSWGALWLRLSALAGGAVVLAQGQADLNTYWRRARGEGVPFRAHWAEWLALGFLGVVFLTTWSIIFIGTVLDSVPE